MKSIFTGILVLLFVVNSFGQGKPYPKILILVPNQALTDETSENDIHFSEKRIKITAKKELKEQKQFASEMRNEADNTQFIFKKDQNFLKYLDFYSNISFQLEQHLQFKLMEKFPNQMVYCEYLRSEGSQEEMDQLAKKEGVDYIINMTEVNTFVQAGKKNAKIKFQFFDNNQHTFLINKEYWGNDKNPGSEFSCETGTIDCTVNNAARSAAADVIKILLRGQK